MPTNDQVSFSGETSSERIEILSRIDDIKRDRNIPVHQKMTAKQLIEKHLDAVFVIHQAGRPQSDVYIYIESQEGRLELADDTLRKAINKVIKNWRKQPPISAASSKPARFADKFNAGGAQW